MGCMGRCWRDPDPLFHSSGIVLPDVDPQIQGEVRLESCARESGYQIITKYDDLMEGGKTFMSKD